MARSKPARWVPPSGVGIVLTKLTRRGVVALDPAEARCDPAGRARQRSSGRRPEPSRRRCPRRGGDHVGDRLADRRGLDSPPAHPWRRTSRARRRRRPRLSSKPDLEAGHEEAHLRDVVPHRVVLDRASLGSKMSVSGQKRTRVPVRPAAPCDQLELVDRGLNRPCRRSGRGPALDERQPVGRPVPVHLGDQFGSRALTTEAPTPWRPPEAA